VIGRLHSWDGADPVFLRKYVAGQWGHIVQRITAAAGWAFKNRTHDRAGARRVIQAARASMKLIDADPPHWIERPDEAGVALKYERAARWAEIADTEMQRLYSTILHRLAVPESKRRAGLATGRNAMTGQTNRSEVIRAWRRHGTVPEDMRVYRVARAVGLTDVAVRAHLRAAGLIPPAKPRPRRPKERL
jgi:hypothetical protein